MNDDTDPYLPPQRIEVKAVRGSFVRFEFRLRTIPVCLSLVVALLAILWVFAGIYGMLAFDSPADVEVVVPLWVFTGSFLGIVNVLAAWCWMKGYFAGGLIANLCSPMPIGVFGIYMEMFYGSF